MIRIAAALVFFAAPARALPGFVPLNELSAQGQAIVQLVLTSTVRIKTRSSSGTGVVISKEGLIATAAHVVGSESTADIEFFSGLTLTCPVVATDDHRDVALIQLPQRNWWPEANLRSSLTMRQGDPIYGLGQPGGEGLRAVEGTIEHVVSDLYAGEHFGIGMQLAFISRPGVSGGPVFTNKGEVIGLIIYDLTLEDNRGAKDLPKASFAIPIEYAWAAARDYMTSGRIRRPRAGIEADHYKEHPALPIQLGMLVSRVEPGSSAARAGIQAGDQIVKVDATEVTPALYQFDHWMEGIMLRKAPGDRLVLEIRRGGVTSPVVIFLEGRAEAGRIIAEPAGR